MKGRYYMDKFKTFIIKSIAGIMMVCLGVIAIMFFTATENVSAQEGGIVIETVNYSNSTITFSFTGDDTRLYISDAKQKKWEYIPIVKDSDSNGKFAFDFSWIPTTKDYTLSVKGDVSTEPVTVVIPKQETKFKAAYNVETGEITFTNDNEREIQWRKKNGYHWETVESTADLKKKFDSMISNGASVVFRLAPVDGSGANGGLRPSKEVSFTIPKKTAAPKITVNNTLMAIAVTKDLEYRYTDKNGMPLEGCTEWTGFENSENVQLSVIAGKAIYTPQNPSPVDQYIQFRTKATKSKQVSNNSTVKIPAQVPLTTEETQSFSLEYIGSNSFTIKAGLATAEQPYEYCIIGKSSIDEGVDLTKPEKLTWKTITSADAVTVTNTKNAYDNGSMVYVRRKASGNLGDDDYKLASDIYTLSSDLSYPGDPEAQGTSEFERIVGTCRKENSEGYITFALYCPANVTITKLKFGTSDSEYKELNPEDFKSVTAENGEHQGDNDKYIITTTIYSTKQIESFLTSNSSDTEVKLTGVYCIGNTTEYNDFDKSPLKLTLKPASHVIIPDETLIEKIKSNVTALEDVDRIGFTKAIKRVYMSDRKYGTNGYTADNADKDIFRTVIKVGAKRETPVSVSSVKYDNVTISLTGEYIKTYTFEDETNQYIVLEMDADKIEDLAGITLKDTNAPVYITLDNGEVISELTMNLMSSAKLKDDSTGATFDPNAVKAYKTVTVIEENGTTIISEEPNRDYYIEYKVNISGYEDLTADSATFNGVSVIYDVDSAKGRVYLSVERIQEYAKTFGMTQTGYVEIGFSNGFRITSGYRLTLLKND